MAINYLENQNEPYEVAVEKYVDLRREDEKLEGYGVRTEDHEVSLGRGRINTVIKNCNNQSSLVLKHTSADIAEPLKPGHNIEEEESTPRKHTLLEDLIDDSNKQTYVTLQIQDKHRYLETHATNDQIEKKKEFGINDMLSAFNDELQVFAPTFQISLAPEVSTRVAQEINRLSESAAESATLLLKMTESMVNAMY